MSKMSPSSSSSDPVAGCETMPGYRFAPTDEELIQHYMTRIISGYPILQSTIIPFDVYSAEPSTLPCEFVLGNRRNEAYFFTPRHRPTGYRGHGNQVSRTVGSTGVWHINGETDVRDRRGKVIGRKATFTFKKRTGYGKDGLVGTDWKMQELLPVAGDGQFQEWAVCRIYKKKRAAGDDEGEDAAASQSTPMEAQARRERESSVMSSALHRRKSYTRVSSICCPILHALCPPIRHWPVLALQIKLDPDYFTGFEVQPARNCCTS